MYLLGLLWIPDIIIWILVLVVALYLYSTWHHSSLQALGYKGPKPKAFIGNMDLLFDTGYFGSFDIVGKERYGKVYAMYEGRSPTLTVFEPDVIKEIMVKHFSNFVDRRDLFLRGKIMRHSLIDTRGSVWKRYRNLTTPFFTTGKLRRNMSCLEFCVNNLIKKCDKYAESKESLELKENAGAFTLEVICLTAFGVEVDSQSDPNHPLISAARKMTSISPKYWGLWVGFSLPFMIPFLEWLGCEMWPEDTVDTMARLTKEIIYERRKSEQERPDFLQMLLKVHEMDVEEVEADGVVSGPENNKKPLTEDEVIAQVALFVMAGYDTTASALSFLLYQLAANPHCQDKVLKEIHDVMGDGEISFDKVREMTYVGMCLDESMRLFPSTFRNERKCLRDISINGYFIPKDTLVTIPMMALQRDPEFWEDPLKYDPERFSPENRKKIHPAVYQPFGAGPRNCVGQRLAQLEIRMAVINIVKRFKITVSKKTKEPITLEKAFLPKVEGGLWVNLEKR